MINVRLQPTSPTTKLTPTIKVIGVGGAGGNAVNNMIESHLQGVEFIVTNTDAQALTGSEADNKIQLGVNVTSGLGAGAKPEIGRMAAEETLDDVMAAIDGANMVFVTAGMGGGTGTGAAPIIAKACRELDILTVGVVTKPFHFEGSTRMKMAEEGIKELQEYVDTLIVIPNQNLFRIANEKTTFSEAFRMADTVLQSAVRGITELIVNEGLINLDFADIRSVMLEMGKAVMGTGEASGEKRAVEAAEKAISNPLLDDVSMKGARGVIVNVTGGSDMTLFEADEACNRIRDEVDPDANIIFGTSFDDTLEGTMRVSIVATGIDKEEVKKTRPLGGAIGGGVTLERARPKTTTQTQGVTTTQQNVTAQPAAQPYGQNQVSQISQSVQVQPDVTQVSESQAKEPEPEAEMFEQQDLIQQLQADKIEITAPLRGSVQGESFIAPAPATAQNYAPAPTVTNTSAQATPQTTTNSGLQLRPPVPGSNKPKRSPSLFERITGGAFTQEPQDEFSADVNTVTQTRASEVTPSKASQGRLNIEASAKPSVEEELDIPAFLRRQAN